MENASIFDKGVAKVREAVSSVSIEQRGFVKAFVRLCSDGWNQGWHERNGGNLTYRMGTDEVVACRSFFNETPRPWMSMGVCAKNLGGACLLTTGSGKYMRNVGLDPSANIGIVEINEQGDAWRVVWGLDNGALPTSELPTHFLAHSVREGVGAGSSRVVYHAHPANLIAMTFALPSDARIFSRSLWRGMPECVMVFPQGVGVVPWMVPGSPLIAQATSIQMQEFEAVIWAQHGLFCVGDNFDAAFGLMHTVEKAAEIYVKACNLSGNFDFASIVSDDALRAIARAYKLPLNEDFLTPSNKPK